MLSRYAFEFKEKNSNNDYYDKVLNSNGYNILLHPFYQLRVGNIRSGTIIQAADWTGIRASTSTASVWTSYYEGIAYTSHYPNVAWDRYIGLSLRTYGFLAHFKIVT